MLPTASGTLRPARVLVVDDEPPILELVRAYLQREGMEVLVAADGPTAVAAVRERDPDVVVLDVMLPGFDGIEVCRQVRTFSDVYVIMLTARDEEVDRVVGLSIGADDYLVKPFSPRELAARIKAVLRRPRASEVTAAGARHIGSLSVDAARRRVAVDGREVPLTGFVEDLRDLWRAEARELPLQTNPIPVDTVLADVAERFTAEAERRGISLRVSPSTAGLRGLADRSRLDQIMGTTFRMRCATATRGVR